jgi:hypothetical protein
VSVAPTGVVSAEAFGTATVANIGPLQVIDLGAVTASDDFNRTNNATAMGTGWTTQVATMGTNNNAAYCSAAGTTGVASNNTPMTSLDHSVTITMGAVATADQGIFIEMGCNPSGEGVIMYVKAGVKPYIATQTAWGATPTTQVTASAASPAVAADTFTIKRVGNVYTGQKNGADLAGLSWTDATNVVPRDSSHLLTGLSVVNVTGQYRRIDAFSAVSASGVGTTSAEAFGAPAVFTAFNELNAVVTGKAVPLGATSLYITMLGQGGAGGNGGGGTLNNECGGGGGGGAGIVNRSSIAVSSLGSTYSTTVTTGYTTANVNGADTTFVSGSVSITCGGGKAGGGGTTSVVGAGGAAGVVTVSGVAGISSANGTAGGNGGTSSTAGVAAVNNTAGGGPGGGGGGGRTSGGGTASGGKGGNSTVANGGTAGPGAGTNGNTSGTAGVPGGGGGGSGSGNNNSYNGGSGGASGGAGGGGSGGDNTGAAGTGGAGSGGYLLLEWS